MSTTTTLPLSQLPAGAHLINAGRGAVIDQADLLELLQSGRLASALLDVFAAEPLPPDDPLWRHPRVRALRLGSSSPTWLLSVSTAGARVSAATRATRTPIAAGMPRL